MDIPLTQITGYAAIISAISDLDAKIDLIPKTEIDYSRTGFIDTTGLSTGTGEDFRYFDITISSVSDVNKCQVDLIGGGAQSGGAGTDSMIQNDGDTSITTFKLTARLTSATNLRVSCFGNAFRFVARYTIGVPE